MPAYPGCDKVSHDDAELFRCLKDASEKGDPLAEHRMGDLHEAGRGVPRDPAEAAKWFRMAADSGDAKGKENLEKLKDLYRPETK